MGGPRAGGVRTGALAASLAGPTTIKGDAGETSALASSVAGEGTAAGRGNGGARGRKLGVDGVMEEGPSARADASRVVGGLGSLRETRQGTQKRQLLAPIETAIR